MARKTSPLSMTLVNPPSPFLINQKGIPPLGILYVAAYLREKGHEVHVVDLADMQPNDLYTSCPDTDLYGVTATTPQYPQALGIKNVLKLQFPKRPVFLGGPHASALMGQCSGDGFDVVIRGEGESATAYGATGAFLNQLAHPPIRDLDNIPPPAWDLIDMESYGYSFGYGPSAPIITSRGCSWGKCTFCSAKTVFPSVRYHRPPRVLSDIRALMRHGFISFQILDDAFTALTGRLLSICEMIKPLRIKWRCYSRAGIPEYALRSMKEAGCVEIGFGAESGSQTILDGTSKGTTVEGNTRFVQDCKHVGITVQAFLMVGLPRESTSTVQETIRWFQEAAPDKFGLNIFTPYPGSAIYEEPGKYGVRLRETDYGKMFVKGTSPDQVCATVATKNLDFGDIERFYLSMMERFTQQTGFKPGVDNG